MALKPIRAVQHQKPPLVNESSYMLPPFGGFKTVGKRLKQYNHEKAQDRDPWLRRDAKKVGQRHYKRLQKSS